MAAPTRGRVSLPFVTGPVISQRRERRDLVVRHPTVAAVRPVTEHIVRVTLAGDDLAGFVATGPADHVKLFFPAGDPAPGSADAPTVARDYTPLDFRPGANELDIDVVLHADGPASAWAARARPGDRLTVAGPRGSRLVPDGLGTLVLVVDESAFPATARWLRMTPPAVPITVLACADRATTSSYFADVPGSERARFVVGGDREAALRAVPIDARTYVFLAGEATALVPLRRYLRRELGLPAEQVRATGYWRRGVAGLDHHAPVDPDDPD